MKTSVALNINLVTAQETTAARIVWKWNFWKTTLPPNPKIWCLHYSSVYSMILYTMSSRFKVGIVTMTVYVANFERHFAQETSFPTLLGLILI